MVLKRQLQQGFALASAIVLLVLLAGIGAAMLALGTGQQTGFTQDLMGSRAQAAARSGIEWMMYQLVQVASPGATNKCDMFGGATVRRQTLDDANLSSAFPGLTITVRCHQVSSGNGMETYVMNAIACTQQQTDGQPTRECLGSSGGGVLYVERFSAGGLCLLTGTTQPNIPCP